TEVEELGDAVGDEVADLASDERSLRSDEIRDVRPTQLDPLGHLPVVVVVPTAVQPEVPDASDVGQNRAVRTTRVRCLLGHRHVRVRLLKRPPASCADVVSPERTSTILLAGNFSRNRPNALCHRYDATCFP